MKKGGLRKNLLSRNNHGLKLVYLKIGSRVLSSSGFEEKESLVVIFFIIGISYYTNLLLDLEKASTFDKLPN